LTKKLTVTIILMKVIHSFDVYGMFPGIHSFDVYGMFPGIRIMLSMRDNAYDVSIVHVFGFVLVLLL
jgi:hypothetical protein